MQGILKRIVYYCAPDIVSGEKVSTNNLTIYLWDRDGTTCRRSGVFTPNTRGDEKNNVLTNPDDNVRAKTTRLNVVAIGVKCAGNRCSSMQQPADGFDAATQHSGYCS